MQKRYFFGAALAGLLAGIVNGIFGGAGGMLLIPALQRLTDIREDALFPMSVSVMLPVCLLSVWLASRAAPLPWADSAPYLLGSIGGGLLVGLFGRRIPTIWLHRIFGVMILWGGIRYLWGIFWWARRWDFCPGWVWAAGACCCFG